MQMKLLWIMLAFVVLAGNPLSATTITFDEDSVSAGGLFNPPLGTRPSTEYLHLGALFQSIDDAGFSFVATKQLITSSPFANNFLTIFSAVPQSTATNLAITFWNPLNGVNPGTVLGSSISMDLADGNIEPNPRVTVRTYDIDGQSIETLALTSFQQTLQFSSGQVHRIVIEDTGADGHVLDNLVFGEITVTEVPEPAAIILVGGGLVFISRFWRRNRVQAGN